MWGASSSQPSVTIFGTLGGLADIIKFAKIDNNRSKGSHSVKVPENRPCCSKTSWTIWLKWTSDLHFFLEGSTSQIWSPYAWAFDMISCLHNLDKNERKRKKEQKHGGHCALLVRDYYNFRWTTHLQHAEAKGETWCTRTDCTTMGNCAE